MIKKIILIFFLLSNTLLDAQTISFSELQNSATNSSNGKFVELLTTKGFTFVDRKADEEWGGFYSTFASGYNSTDGSWRSLIHVQSFNMVEFIFSDNSKSNFSNLLNQIKTTSKKECFKYSGLIKNYFTSYYLPFTPIRFIVYTEKGENGYSDTYHIIVINIFSDKEKMNFSISEKYNNAAWYYLCDDPNSK